MLDIFVTPQVPRPNRRDSALRLSADGQHIAACSVRLWQVTSGQAQGTVPTGMRGRCQDLSSYIFLT